MVTTKNILFKWVSGDLVDAYIAGKGEWTVTNIAKQVQDVVKEESNIFGDL